MPEPIPGQGQIYDENWYARQDPFGPKVVIPDLYTLFGANPDDSLEAIKKKAREKLIALGVSKGDVSPARLKELQKDPDALRKHEADRHALQEAMIAYDILKDSEKRARYDRKRLEQQRHAPPTPVSTASSEPRRESSSSYTRTEASREQRRTEPPPRTERPPSFDVEAVHSRIAQMDDLNLVSQYIVELLNQYPTNSHLIKWFQNLKLLQLKASTVQAFAQLSSTQKDEAYWAYKELGEARIDSVRTFGKVLENLKPIFVPYEQNSQLESAIRDHLRGQSATVERILEIAAREYHRRENSSDPRGEDCRTFAPSISLDLFVLNRASERYGRARELPISQVANIISDVMGITTPAFLPYKKEICFYFRHYILAPDQVVAHYHNLRNYMNLLNGPLQSAPLTEMSVLNTRTGIYENQDVTGNQLAHVLGNFVQLFEESNPLSIDWGDFARRYAKEGCVLGRVLQKGAYKTRHSEEKRLPSMSGIPRDAESILREYFRQGLLSYARIRLADIDRYESYEELEALVDLVVDPRDRTFLHNLKAGWELNSTQPRLIFWTKRKSKEQLENEMKPMLERSPFLRLLLPREIIRLLDEKYKIPNRS